MVDRGMYQSIERLSGRDNYHTWAIAMKAYLRLDDLWDTVEAPTGGSLSTDAKKIVKAHSRLILAIEPQLYTHVQQADSAKEVWKKLKDAFADDGVMRRVSLFNEFISTTLENCASVEEYVHKVITCAHKLENAQMTIPDEWLAFILLTGLPEAYKPMVMALESCGKKLTSDFVKSKILQEVKIDSASSKGDSHAFASMHHNQRKPPFDKNKNSNLLQKRKKALVKYYNCNKLVHLAKDCKMPNKRAGQVYNAQEASDSDTDDEATSMCAYQISMSRNLKISGSSTLEHQGTCVTINQSLKISKKSPKEELVWQTQAK
ncbi:uncharacterized protein LOC111643506 [Copidosoma floridanum]|uniref:uncharacterized protein LOC111643506 n=1 Tax=Copidosoma floridanum TaxID=29053 RepID=UPI000C6FC72A|nr:uncharacterized protein LOC111643506 [Copidosoma floridanum]